jgi:hypothetical protein
MIANTEGICTYTTLHLGWGAFMDRIDAGLWRGDVKKQYLFSGGWYVRYSDISAGIDEGYPKPIAGNWSRLKAPFTSGIDAALWRQSNGRSYLFKGSQYVRLTGSKVDDGYPKPIAGNWKGLPSSFQAGIDAALWRGSNGKIYLFKGDQYVRLTETSVDAGYPKPIAGNWKGLPASFGSGIDSALWRESNSKIYFFRDRRYARLTGATMDAGYPRWVDGVWMPFPR